MVFLQAIKVKSPLFIFRFDCFKASFYWFKDESVHPRRISNEYSSTFLGSSLICT